MNYFIRLAKEKIKEFKARKYCPVHRQHMPHKAKEVKGGY